MAGGVKPAHREPFKLVPPLTCVPARDAAKRNPFKRNPVRLLRVEREYGRALKSVAWHVGDLIRAFKAGADETNSALNNLLRAYSDALKPWARVTAARMLGDVDAQDKRSWASLGEAISGQLHHDLRRTEMGDVMRERLHAQVQLITSLPLEAGERVHRLTLEALESGGRANAIAEEIARSGEVTASRAQLIARTEVAKTASILTQTRAESAGSTHYFWRTAGDADVRPGHKAMSGRICEWARPPAVNEGGRLMHHHPGQIWNCRCWPEAIIDDPY